jgi:hypothetical protein
VAPLPHFQTMPPAVALLGEIELMDGVGGHVPEDKLWPLPLPGWPKRSAVLEHSLENRETVECISQFAMLLRVCDRQSP